MPWHDETPWAAKRRIEQARQKAVYDRLDRIESLVTQARRGQVSISKALDEIEDVARGGADAIVRVGTPHVPDMQTAMEER
jgi:hypothetical protein